MIELSRKLEIKDIISNLATISVDMQAIAAKRKLGPSELYRIEETMDGLLAIRQVICVNSQYNEREELQKAADLMFEVGTHAMHEVKTLRLHGSQAAQDVENMLGYYSDAVTAALTMVSLADPFLEPRFRTALQWTT